MQNLFGRKVIYTFRSDLNIDSIAKIVNGAITRHEENSRQIEHLEKYFTGNQPILKRNKVIRPNVNNKIVVNNANPIFFLNMHTTPMLAMAK